jgi:hypothetical protein
MKLRDSLLVVGFGLLVGCDRPPAGPQLVPAEGTVTLDGKSLSGATLIFQPQDNTAGQGGTARTDAGGKFSLTSFDLKAKGTAAGSYRVVISKKVNPDGSDFAPSADQDPMLAAYKEILPPQYSDDAQTTLTAEVPPEGTKNIEFHLSSKLK